jgi:Cu/Ag efflux protein CusF
VRAWTFLALLLVALGGGFLAIYLVLTLYVRSIESQAVGVQPPTGSRQAEERVYSSEGKVEAVFPDLGVIVIAHREIKGVMPPMTMRLKTGESALLAGIETGDRVRFRLKLAPDHPILIAIEKVP